MQENTETKLPMISKQYAKNNKTAKVTFELPADSAVAKGALLGDFNNWDNTATPLKRRKDGTLYATVSLEAGREYRFRYLTDEGAWINDPAADAYADNPFGSTDSVVIV